MFDEELSSFVSKFHQLRRAGLTAHLDVDTCAGKAWVGLRVMLDPVHHPHLYPQNVPNVRRRSPSYYRRQERRKAAKAAAGEQASSSIAVHAETEKVPENKDNDKNSVSDSEYECDLCDFSSNREKGLKIHKSRKHPIIEQIDGNASIAEHA